MDDPRRSYMNTIKRILRCLRGIMDYAILFQTFAKNSKTQLICYSDANQCDNKVNRRNTIGNKVQFFGSSISLCSTKLPIIALSSCEAEYIFRSYVACQSHQVELVLEELKQLVKLQTNNKKTINLKRNSILHGKSYMLRLYFIA